MLRYFILFIALPFQLTAQEIDTDNLVELLRYDELAEIVRLEGIHVDSALPEEFEIIVDQRFWLSTLDRVYDQERIEAQLIKGFLANFNPRSYDPVLAFLASDDWVRIFDLLNQASLEMLDPVKEAAAIEVYWQNEDTQSPRLKQIAELLGSTYLIDQNVAGWMNGMIAFNYGMAAADPDYSSTEEDLMAILMEDEDLARQEIGEWLMAYYMLALSPVSDVGVDRQIAFWTSRAGSDLSNAMMSAYDAVFDVTDFAVGKALVEAALGDEL